MKHVALAFLLIACVAGVASAGVEGPVDLAIVNDGTWYVGSSSYWNMYATDNPGGDIASATTLPNPVPEYHWWNGCSPTAAGMLFSYWDTHLGKSNLYDGDSSNWDKVNMDHTNSAHYDNEHNIVASYGHYLAGQAKSPPAPNDWDYGSWDRNGNGIVDDQAQWDCLADFMLTENGGTSRGNMAQGFLDYAAWDNPLTALNESYQATVDTQYVSRGEATWADYIAEIDAGRPVHVGITGHSILGFGYYEGTTPWHTTPTKFVVNWTTWGGGWDGLWGLVEYEEVYGFTTLEIGDWNGAVPEPTTLAIWSAFGALGLIASRRRKRAA